MTASAALQEWAQAVAAWPIAWRLTLRCVDCEREPACQPWPVADPSPVCAACWEWRRARG